MTMQEKIPINPILFKWARETAGLSIDDVARKMKKDRGVILAWENGESAPTYSQLEKLAYEVFKRPLAVFFFPQPPKEPTPKQSFRTLPDFEIDRFSPRMRLLVRQANAMQINLSELNDGKNPSQKNILKDLRILPSSSPFEMAKTVRKYLGVSIKEQMKWLNVDDALNHWREIIEDCGIFVFKEAFKEDSCSGFCLYHDEFPITYLNNSKPKTRQIFSLFHELAHLLLGTGGIDAKNDDFISSLTGINRKIEILCNAFAGEFLVPASDFEKEISVHEINDRGIRDLSELFKVSREVILRRLLENRLIDREYYAEKSHEWSDENRAKAKCSGGDFYATKRVYLGQKFLELTFGKYYQKRITIDELAEFLGVKVNSIPKMEDLLYFSGSRKSL